MPQSKRSRFRLFVLGRLDGTSSEQSLTAFWIIAGVMFALLVGMVAYFRRRGWL